MNKEISEKAQLNLNFREKEYLLEWGSNPRKYYSFRAEIEKFFVRFLVQMKISISPFENNWPLFKTNIFLQYPESVMFRDCSDLNFKEYLDVIKEPIAMDVIKEKLDRDNPEMVSVNQGCLMLSQIQFTTVHAQL